MQVWCHQCGKYTEHRMVSPERDPQNAWKHSDTGYLSSCRGVKSDYRTTECAECKLVTTGDFATD